jgi:hypothetical protein
MVWNEMVWYGMVLYVIVHYGTVWYVINVCHVRNVCYVCILVTEIKWMDCTVGDVVKNITCNIDVLCRTLL